MRQIPNPVRIGRLTARGGRVITSSSCGSNEITKPSATDVTMFTHRIWGAVIGMVKPTKIAAMMTSAWAILVGSMNSKAFSMFRPALLHRRRYRGKVVVGKHHLGRLLGDLGALDAHR